MDTVVDHMFDLSNDVEMHAEDQVFVMTFASLVRRIDWFVEARVEDQVLGNAMDQLKEEGL